MPPAPKTWRDLEAEVEKLLKGAKIDYETHVVVGDARPDFLVTTENGKQIAIEVKHWQKSPDSRARALKQARRYLQLSNAAGAMVVTPALADSVHSASVAVTPVAKLIATLATLGQRLAQQKTTAKKQRVHSAPKKIVFASMPFAAKYDDTFLVAIEPASLANGAIAERVDHYGKAGPVVPQIKAMIRSAKAIVADLSESRPSVLHEIGYAEALRKPVIQICSTSIDALPFNVRNNRTILYAIGQTSKLRRALETELEKHV